MIKKAVCKLHKDERGSAMVMVIVAVAFIAILISTLFWVTMSNFFMKYTDAKNKETFYSAETVFEEMKAGMQTRASSELMGIYAAALGNYTNGTSEAEIQNKYLNAVYDFYRRGSGVTERDYFKEELLLGYVEDQFNPYYAGVTDEAVATPPTTAFDRYEAKMTGKCEIVKTDSEVVLKNITIQFYDHDTGNYSKITSDLAVGLPNMKFTKASELPAIFDYAIVGDKGVKIGNDVELVLHKNIYSGEDGIQVGDGISPASSVGASLNLEDVSYAVTRGTISLNGMANNGTAKSGIKTGEKTRLYAHDINVYNGKGELNGKTYVANDLKYDAAGDFVVKGDYFGFGNSVSDANASSAILINSKNVNMNMNDAGAVLLAGHAFIGTEDNTAKQIESGITPGTITVSKNSNNIMMDQSISVKGDQVAYLIPGNCIGVWKYDNGNIGDVIIGQNPVPNVKVSMNAAGVVEPYFYGSVDPEKYKDGHIEIVDFESGVHALKGNSLGYYSNEYRVVYKRQYGEILAYFYIVLGEDKAKEDIEDYYGVKKPNVDAYYQFYLKRGIIDNSLDNKNINAAGHYLSGLSTNKLEMKGANTGSLAQTQNSLDIGSTYEALCTKLLTDNFNISEYEKSRTVFQNIISENRMPTGQVVYSVGSGDDKIRAVITNGDFDYTSGNLAGEQMKNIHMIIAGGDVSLNCDFSGLVLAKGTITAKKDEGGASSAIAVSSTREDLIRLLQAITIDEGSGNVKSGVTMPMDIFIDGSRYVLEGTSVSSNGVSSDKDTVNFGELVKYENWAKK